MEKRRTAHFLAWVTLVASIVTLITLSGLTLSNVSSIHELVFDLSSTEDYVPEKIPDSNEPPPLDFWEKSPIYQVYPRSFKVSITHTYLMSNL